MYNIFANSFKEKAVEELVTCGFQLTIVVTSGINVFNYMIYCI